MTSDRPTDPLPAVAADGHAAIDRWGRLRAIAILLAVVAAVVAAMLHAPTYYVRVADRNRANVSLAVGLNMVVGYAGLLDLGFVAFYAIGAYSYAILASGQFGIHLPFGLVLIIGGALAGTAGVLLGIPVLRLRGDYLAIVTLGFGEIIRLLLNNLDRLTNGPQGISRIDQPHIFGLALATPQDFLWLLLPLVAVAFTIVWRIENSILGLGWAAIREDQDAARGIGIDTTRAKLLAFGLSAVLGGFAGVIFAGFQRFVDPVSFTFWESLTVVLIVVIGGLGNLIGILVGAAALVILPELLRGYSEYRMFLYGLALVVVILLRPRGLIDRRYNPAWLIRRLGWR